MRDCSSVRRLNHVLARFTGKRNPPARIGGAKVSEGNPPVVIVMRMVVAVNVIVSRLLVYGQLIYINLKTDGACLAFDAQVAAIDVVTA